MNINRMRLVESVLNNLKSDIYGTHDIQTNELMHGKRIQVRSKKIDEAKVKAIVEYVKEFDDDSEFDPAVALIDDDNEVIALLDGNHTVEARFKLGKKYTPTIRIPFADLYFDMSAARKLGHALNVVIRKDTESSDADIKEMIKADMTDGMDVNSDSYKRSLGSILKKSQISIGRLVGFTTGSDDGDRRVLTEEERQQYKEDMIAQDDTRTVVVNSTHGASGGQALGSILNQMRLESKDRGLIVLYHRMIPHEEKYRNIVKQLRQSIAYHDLNIEVQIIGFVTNE